MIHFRTCCSPILSAFVAFAQAPDPPAPRPELRLRPSATVTVTDDARAPWEDHRAARLRETQAFLLADLRVFRAQPSGDEIPNPGPPQPGPPPSIHRYV